MARVGPQHHGKKREQNRDTKLNFLEQMYRPVSHHNIVKPK